MGTAGGMGLRGGRSSLGCRNPARAPPIPGYLGLYVFYVFTVVLCTWIHRRQRGEGPTPPSPWEPGKGCMAGGTPSMLGCASTAPSSPVPPEMPTDAEERESSGPNSGDYGTSFLRGSGGGWGSQGPPGCHRHGRAHRSRHPCR